MYQQINVVARLFGGYVPMSVVRIVSILKERKKEREERRGFVDGWLPGDIFRCGLTGSDTPMQSGFLGSGNKSPNLVASDTPTKTVTSPPIEDGIFRLHVYRALKRMDPICTHSELSGRTRLRTVATITSPPDASTRT